MHKSNHHQDKDAASENAKLAAKYAAESRKLDSSSGSETVSTVIVDKGKESVAEQPIIKETIKEVELHRVQPVVHRVREQTEIRHVIQPIMQKEVAPIEAKEVIRETGIVREQVSVHDRSMHSEGHNMLSGNNAMMMLQSMGVMSGGETVPMQMTGCCKKSMLPGNGYRGHNHQVQHDDDCRGLMTSAGVLPSDAGGRPIQIHIHPVFYLSPNGMGGLQGIDWEATLCTGCNAKVQALTGGSTRNHVHMHESVGEPSRDKSSSGELSRDKSSSKEDHKHGHRISRFLHTKLRRKKSGGDSDSSGDDESDDDNNNHSGNDQHHHNHSNTVATESSVHHHEHSAGDTAAWTDESEKYSSKIGGQASRDARNRDTEEVIRIVHTPVVI
eukprot:TRINITY_DN16257_c0_g1_i1.p1 TRINITY_DN16257_c0_g1~~TRINITY_DN16257_c0_g1_i1.p1  ORF type:complete len:385 (-),score=84.73 TRINITY_DN16257_c0_g1_i1:25-1179(-)